MESKAIGTLIQAIKLTVTNKFSKKMSYIIPNSGIINQKNHHHCHLQHWHYNC